MTPIDLRSDTVTRPSANGAASSASRKASARRADPSWPPRATESRRSSATAACRADARSQQGEHCATPQHSSKSLFFPCFIGHSTGLHPRWLTRHLGGYLSRLRCATRRIERVVRVRCGPGYQASFTHIHISGPGGVASTVLRGLSGIGVRLVQSSHYAFGFGRGQPRPPQRGAGRAWRHACHRSHSLAATADCG
jgi:hypothetical protein